MINTNTVDHTSAHCVDLPDIVGYFLKLKIEKRMTIYNRVKVKKSKNMGWSIEGGKGNTNLKERDTRCQ